MSKESEILLQVILNAILVPAIIGFFLIKRDETIKGTIQEEFKKRDVFFNAQFNFKQRSVEELLGPMMLQLKRSEITLRAYSENNPYREKILKECNETVRDLLLKKGFLIPSDLLPDAGDLIKHYDEWLQVYYEVRMVQKNKETPFIFTYNFPKQAEINFSNKYHEFRNELMIDAKLK